MLNLSICPLSVAIHVWFHFSRKDKFFLSNVLPEDHHKSPSIL